MELIIEDIDFVDVRVEASGDDLNILRSSVLPNDPRNPNLFTIMTYQGNQGGVVGIAWVGVVCRSEKGIRASINEWIGDDLLSAEVLQIA